MRILIIGINYAPELTGVGRYTGEMVEALAAAGHEVRVITAPPYYPEWRVPAEYRSWWYRAERSGDVTVYRCPIWVPEHPAALKRLLHLASFAVLALPVALRQIAWKPDVVWTVEPALFAAPLSPMVARLCGAAAWLHIQDYEVDAAFDLGMLKGRRVRQFALAVECFLLKRFDRVSTISQRMLAKAKSKGVAEERLVFFPNWVDVQAIRPLLHVSSFREQLKIPASAIVALYSGNMASKQGLEILGEVVRKLSGHMELFFVFCGDGSAKRDLQAQCEGLESVRFISLQPMDRLNDLLGMADVHLLPQRADAADLVMPSKLTGMLSSGRPVVATAARGTELASVVEECGVVVPPGNGEALAAAILTLAGDAALRGALGRAAREIAEQRLSQESILQRFERDLAACASSRKVR